MNLMKCERAARIAGLPARRKQDSGPTTGAWAIRLGRGRYAGCAAFDGVAAKEPFAPLGLLRSFEEAGTISNSLFEEIEFRLYQIGQRTNSSRWRWLHAEVSLYREGRRDVDFNEILKSVS
jgi:hypothetical protein